MLKKVRLAFLPALFLLLAGRASASCSPVLCTVYLFIDSNSSGMVLLGSGTSAASMAFGSIQAFGGTLPGGVSRLIGGSTFTLSTPFNIYVYCEDLILLGACTTAESPSFQLTAQLQTADLIDTWTLSGLTLSSSTASVLTSAGTYGVATPYSFSVVFPFSRAPGSMSNYVNLVATTN